MSLLPVELAALKQLVFRCLGGIKCETARATLETHMNRLFYHNLKGGKWERARITMDTYAALQPNRDSTQIRHLALAVQMLHSSFLIADDIIDHATTRHNQPCWHTLVGSTALNDAMLLDSCVDQMVWMSDFNKHIKMCLLNSVHQARLTTCLGQNLDIEKLPIRAYSWERYSDIVRMKTSHYSFLLPVQMAFITAEETIPENVSNLMLKFGYYFQSQDDYLDLSKTADKSTGNDITEGKCTWPLLTTLDLIRKHKHDKRLLQQLEQYYGDNKHLDVVLRIYDNVDLNKEFQMFEQHSQNTLLEEISQLTDSLKNVFLQLLNRMKFRPK